MKKNHAHDIYISTYSRTFLCSRDLSVLFTDFRTGGVPDDAPVMAEIHIPENYIHEKNATRPALWNKLITDKNTTQYVIQKMKRPLVSCALSIHHRMMTQTAMTLWFWKKI